MRHMIYVGCVCTGALLWAVGSVGALHLPKDPEQEEGEAPDLPEALPMLESVRFFQNCQAYADICQLASWEGLPEHTTHVCLMNMTCQTPEGVARLGQLVEYDRPLQEVDLGAMHIGADLWPALLERLREAMPAQALLVKVEMPMRWAALWWQPLAGLERARGGRWIPQEHAGGGQWHWWVEYQLNQTICLRISEHTEPA